MVLDFTTLSGNIPYLISDHMIQFVILQDFTTPKTPHISNAHNRDLDNFDSIKLKEGLRKIDGINEILKNGNIINQIFNHF